MLSSTPRNTARTLRSPMSEPLARNTVNEFYFRVELLYDDTRWFSAILSQVWFEWFRRKLICCLQLEPRYRGGWRSPSDEVQHVLLIHAKTLKCLFYENGSIVPHSNLPGL